MRIFWLFGYTCGGLWFAFLIYLLIMSFRADSRCLAAGYPESTFDVAGHTYCKRKVLATDELVRLP